MKFWDTSAIVPLLVEQASTTKMAGLGEGRSVADRMVGHGRRMCLCTCPPRTAGGARWPSCKSAFERLAQWTASWQEVESSDLVRETAIRLLRVHALRAADSLQLAAAFVAAEGRPPTLELVTLDDRLALAAQKEGFIVVGLDTDPT